MLVLLCGNEYAFMYFTAVVFFLKASSQWTLGASTHGQRTECVIVAVCHLNQQLCVSEHVEPMDIGGQHPRTKDRVCYRCSLSVSKQLCVFVCVCVCACVCVRVSVLSLSVCMLYMCVVCV